MTLIIGEIGSNHISKQDIFDSIVSLKECGADIAKLQLYSHKELYGYDGPQMAGEIPREWIPEFAEFAEKVGIELACTAFSPEGYRFIDPYVKRHKIASAEISDKDILKTIRKLGKPTLFSTGGATTSEINKTWLYLDGTDKDRKLFNTASMEDQGQADVLSTVLYCVSAYPAQNVDLRNIQKLPCQNYERVGYSCHTSEFMTAVYAVRHYGAIVIEKHFKVRPMYTPDSDHSILPADFKRMVELIRCADTDSWIYDSDDAHLMPMPHPDEADFVKYTKRRYIPELKGYFRTKKPE